MNSGWGKMNILSIYRRGIFSYSTYNYSKLLNFINYMKIIHIESLGYNKNIHHVIGAVQQKSFIRTGLARIISLRLSFLSQTSYEETIPSSKFLR